MAVEDIIFGKNRHMFGGIEPSNMLVFKPTLNRFDTAPITMDVQIPSNTVVDGQTLCTVAGAVIRRRRDQYPKDEFDGELVATITDSGLSKISDPGITAIEGMYHYAAFPFTTQGVYNRSIANRFVVNEPLALTDFSVLVSNIAKRVTVRVAFPTDEKYPLAGVIIRKSTTGYPIDENDGESVTTLYADPSQTEMTYVDENIEPGNTYFYSAFTYTENGDVNRSLVNRSRCYVSTGIYLFGYDMDINDSNPATRISYPTDVDNAYYNPAKMNFETLKFDYGDWPQNPGDGFMPRPCMLNFDGTVGEYLDPNDYTKTISGEASNVANVNVDYKGNAMMEWPKIWTKRWEENGIYHFRCADSKIDEDYECWCNYNYEGKQVDHFYTAIFVGVIRSSKLRSLAFPVGASSDWVQTEYDIFENRVWARDTYVSSGYNGWDIEPLVDRLLIQDLLIMMSKSTELESAYGKGFTSSISTSNYKTVGLNKGMFYGVSATGGDYSHAVNIFGMENWWGYLNRFLDGFVSTGDAVQVKYPKSDEYTTLFSLSEVDTNSSGIVSGYDALGLTIPIGRIPHDFDGSLTTYSCTYWYVMHGTYYGTRWVRTTASPAIGYRFDMDSTTSNQFTGAALSYK